MMPTVVLEAGLTARLGALARACGVPPQTVALTGLALLHRRYTGEVNAYGLDLTTDTTVEQTLTTAADLLTDALRGDGMRVVAQGAAGSRADGSGANAAGAGGPRADSLRTEGLQAEGLGWRLEFGCDPELAESMSADLPRLLAAMADDPRQSTVDLLPVAEYERRQPLAAFEPEFPNVSAAFASMVQRFPENIAVLADAGTLTYRQLGAAVTDTARRLGPGGPVALLCQHGPKTIIGLLAALAAGRPYVPLDPSFPKARLAGVVADCGVGAILVGDELGCLAGELAPEAAIVRIGEPVGEPDLETLRGSAKLDDAAYLLYTSGSTGKPKGVMQSHRNVLFSIASHVRHFALTPQDRVSVLASFGYDMAVTDTFGALLTGAAAVPFDVRGLGLGGLAETLARHRVSIYHSTPTVFRFLMSLEQPLPDMRVVLLGGEEVTRRDAELARERCAPEVVFVNGYGATEISFITQYHVKSDVPLDRAVMPVGKALHGVDVVLVDSARRPVCLTGEVLARTEHLALGYWGQPDLTSQRFIEYQGSRAYLTGDLARRLPDGRLVFLARADRMVKIRGHRVELGEVEAHLATVKGVAHAAVVARRNPAGEAEIIGYAVPASGARLDPGALRDELGGALPDFMVPRAIVEVTTLPMGPTGKLDVAALPEPPAPEVAAAPGTALERLIGEAWCDALGLAAIDRLASVVRLGAHSLQMAVVQRRLEQALGRRLPIARLFEFPTVAALAGHLSDDTSTADEAVRRAAQRMQQRRRARS